MPSLQITQLLATPQAQPSGLDVCLLHLRAPHTQLEREHHIRLLDELACKVLSGQHSHRLTCIVTSYAEGHVEAPHSPPHALRPPQVLVGHTHTHTHALTHSLQRTYTHT